MLTQIKQLIARIEPVDTISESAAILLASVREYLADLRGDRARRGEPTSDLDTAIANLDQHGGQLIVALKANTDAKDERVFTKPSHEPEPIVDPNTVPVPVVEPEPEPVAPAIVDPNTLPANPPEPTADLVDARDAEPLDAPPGPVVAASEPPLEPPSPPVLDVAPPGASSDELNAAGARPERLSDVVPSKPKKH